MKIEDKMLEEIAEMVNWYSRSNPYVDWNKKDLSTEDLETKERWRNIAKDFLSIIKVHCVIPEEGEWPSIWNGKEDLKSALTYKADIYEAGYRKVRDIEL